MQRKLVAIVGALTFACGGRSALEVFDPGQDGSTTGGSSLGGKGGSSGSAGKSSSGGSPTTAGAGGASAGAGGLSAGAGGMGGVVNECHSAPVDGIVLPGIEGDSPEIVGLAARPGGRAWVVANFPDQPFLAATLITYDLDGATIATGLIPPGSRGTTADKLRAFALGSGFEAYVALNSTGDWGFGSNGAEQGYLTRWTAEGRFEWAVPTYAPDVQALGLDASNDVFPFGSFQSSGYFVSLVRPSGSSLWSSAMGGDDRGSTGALAVHASGVLTRAGVVTVNGRLSFEVERLTEKGRPQWKALSGCPADLNERPHVEVDEANNIYVIGSAACRLPGSAQFAEGALDWPSLPPAGLVSNAFMVEKLDSFGNLQWTKQVGLGYSTAAQATAIDHEGLLVLAYTKEPSKLPGHNVVLKLDPAGGELWQQAPCGYATWITTDGACQTYVAGTRCDDVPGITVQRISSSN